jgi:hypothetical protein
VKYPAFNIHTIVIVVVIIIIIIIVIIIVGLVAVDMAHI